MRKDRFCQ